MVSEWLDFLNKIGPTFHGSVHATEQCSLTSGEIKPLHNDLPLVTQLEAVPFQRECENGWKWRKPTELVTLLIAEKKKKSHVLGSLRHSMNLKIWRSEPWHTQLNSHALLTVLSWNVYSQHQLGWPWSVQQQGPFPQRWGTRQLQANLGTRTKTTLRRWEWWFR